MLPTSATVAGVADLSKLLEITVAPGITGRSFCGKPATISPTAAEVPGDADGLADAVAADWLVACDEVAEDGVVAPGVAELQAARATAATAARAANPVGLKLPMTVTGTFLLGLMPDSASSLVSTSG
jgi:hypothetical protein